MRGRASVVPSNNSSIHNGAQWEKNGKLQLDDNEATVQPPVKSPEPVPDSRLNAPSPTTHPKDTVDRGSSIASLSTQKRGSSHHRRRSSSSSSFVVANDDASSSTRRPRDSIKEERRLRTSRKTLDDYLRKLSSSGEAIQGVSRSLTLNQTTGTCSFPYQRFLVVVELPQDQPKTVYIYTCVCRLEQETDNIGKVAQTAMELNYLQAGTKGSTLGMRGGEVNLCRSIPIKALNNAAKLGLALEEFLKTASDAHAKLERAKRSFELSTAEEAQRPSLIRRSKKPQHVRNRTFTT